MGFGRGIWVTEWAFLLVVCSIHQLEAQTEIQQETGSTYTEDVQQNQTISATILSKVNIIQPMLTNPLITPSNPAHNGRVCSTWGNFHFKTFDGLIFSFPGLCNYVFASHCTAPYEDFNIQIRRTVVENAPTINRITMKLEGVAAELTKDVVMIDSNRVQLPYSQSGITIEKSSIYVKVASKMGIVLMWNEDDSILLELNEKYANQTCGLCGDFNGLPVYNELYSNNVRMTALQFGNMQKIDGPTEHCEDFTSTLPDNCTDNFDDICQKTLTSAAFLECNGLVDVEEYIMTCQDDLCRSEDSKNASRICDTIAEYSRQCAHAGGHPGEWRTSKLCSKKCPYNMQYQECNSPCADTCTNPKRSQFCEEHCMDGCFCPPETVFDDINNSGCIPQQQCSCIYNGNAYAPGASFSEQCRSCTCNGGQWSCQDLSCPGTCSVEGGSHISTYDRKHYDYHGDCTYVLSKHCKDELFAIVVELRKCGRTDTETCLKTVTLNMNKGQTLIQVKPDGGVFVNSIYTQLPISAANATVFRPSTFFIIIQTNFGLKLEIQIIPIMQVFVRLDPIFKDQTCGLCGNFNDIQTDDFKVINGLIEGTAAAFANTWRTQASCLDIQNSFENPCALSIENEKYAQHWCGLLTDSEGPFADCHYTVNPSIYHTNCMFDTCNCENSEDCLCAALSSYVRACAAKGIQLDGWRTDVCSKYTTSCPKSLSYSYTISSCQPTCRSLSEPDVTCSIKFVPVDGCTCINGTYMDDSGKCVPANECPCYYRGSPVPLGQAVHENGLVCTCIQGRLNCIGALNPAPVCESPMVYFNCGNVTAGTIGAECQKSCWTLDMQCYSTQCISGCVCPAGLVLDGSGDCIPEEDCPCIHNEAMYQPGEKINVDCNTCVCKNRKWECTQDECLGTCAVYGDGHYNTFDDRRFSFNGNCEYTLVQDHCGKSDTANVTFRVVTENIPCGNTGTTCSKSIKVFLESYELILYEEHFSVVKRGQNDEVPYTVRYMGIYLVIETTSGLILMWDKKTSIFIKLSPDFKGEICGLCGNYDGNGINDFTTRSQSVVENVLEFGNSWKVSSTCPDAYSIKDPCSTNPYRKSWSEKQCSIINSNVFAACHVQVDPTQYYQACVTDACACDTGGDCDCFCTAVAAYAQACSEVGVCIAWRTPSICPLFCDYYNQQGECEWHYKPCGASCMKTCRNPSGKCLHNLAGLEGCYPNCPADKPYFNEDQMKCVSLCDCYDTEDGKIYRRDECELCECTLEGLQCKFDDKACYCTYEGTSYKYGELIYNTTDGTGWCFSATCDVNGTINRNIFKCGIFTTTPFTFSTSQPATTASEMATTTPVTTVCVKNVCTWSDWYDSTQPENREDSGDYETFANLREKGYSVCNNPSSVQCRAKEYPDTEITNLNQTVQCSQSEGLICSNKDQQSQYCYNYEIRVSCCSYMSCSEIQTTTPSTTEELKTAVTLTPFTLQTKIPTTQKKETEAQRTEVPTTSQTATESTTSLTQTSVTAKTTPVSTKGTQYGSTPAEITTVETQTILLNTTASTLPQPAMTTTTVTSVIPSTTALPTQGTSIMTTTGWASTTKISPLPTKQTTVIRTTPTVPTSAVSSTARTTTQSTTTSAATPAPAETSTLATQAPRSPTTAPTSPSTTLETTAATTVVRLTTSSPTEGSTISPRERTTIIPTTATVPTSVATSTSTSRVTTPSTTTSAATPPPAETSTLATQAPRSPTTAPTRPSTTLETTAATTGVLVTTSSPTEGTTSIHTTTTTTVPTSATTSTSTSGITTPSTTTSAATPPPAEISTLATQAPRSPTTAPTSPSTTLETTAATTGVRPTTSSPTEGTTNILTTTTAPTSAITTTSAATPAPAETSTLATQAPRSPTTAPSSPSTTLETTAATTVVRPTTSSPTEGSTISPRERTTIIPTTATVPTSVATSTSTSRVTTPSTTTSAATPAPAETSTLATQAPRSPTTAPTSPSTTLETTAATTGVLVTTSSPTEGTTSILTTTTAPTSATTSTSTSGITTPSTTTSAATPPETSTLATQSSTSPSITDNCQPHCEWTQWFDLDSPSPGSENGDTETFAKIRAAGYALCEEPQGIRCRAVNYPESTPEQLGQIVECSLKNGLVCRNKNQTTKNPMCFNYEMQVQCCDIKKCQTSPAPGTTAGSSTTVTPAETTTIGTQTQAPSTTASTLPQTATTTTAGTTVGIKTATPKTQVTTSISSTSRASTSQTSPSPTQATTIIPPTPTAPTSAATSTSTSGMTTPSTTTSTATPAPAETSTLATQAPRSPTTAPTTPSTTLETTAATTVVRPTTSSPTEGTTSIHTTTTTAPTSATTSTSTSGITTLSTTTSAATPPPAEISTLATQAPRSPTTAPTSPSTTLETTAATTVVRPTTSSPTEGSTISPRERTTIIPTTATVHTSVATSTSTSRVTTPSTTTSAATPAPAETSTLATQAPRSPTTAPTSPSTTLETTAATTVVRPTTSSPTEGSTISPRERTTIIPTTTTTASTSATTSTSTSTITTTSAATPAPAETSTLATQAPRSPTTAPTSPSTTLETTAATTGVLVTTSSPTEGSTISPRERTTIIPTTTTAPTSATTSTSTSVITATSAATPAPAETSTLATQAPRSPTTAPTTPSTTLETTAATTGVLVTTSSPTKGTTIILTTTTAPTSATTSTSTSRVTTPSTTTSAATPAPAETSTLATQAPRSPTTAPTSPSTTLETTAATTGVLVTTSSPTEGTTSIHTTTTTAPTSATTSTSTSGITTPSTTTSAATPPPAEISTLATQAPRSPTTAPTSPSTTLETTAATTVVRPTTSSPTEGSTISPRERTTIIPTTATVHTSVATSTSTSRVTTPSTTTSAATPAPAETSTLATQAPRSPTTAPSSPSTTLETTAATTVVRPTTSSPTEGSTISPRERTTIIPTTTTTASTSATTSTSTSSITTTSAATPAPAETSTLATQAPRSPTTAPTSPSTTLETTAATTGVLVTTSSPTEGSTISPRERTTIIPTTTTAPTSATTSTSTSVITATSAATPAPAETSTLATQAPRSPTTAPTTPSTTLETTALTTESSTYATSSSITPCFCHVFGNFFSPGEVVYNRTDKAGCNFYALCSKDCEINPFQGPCPSTTPLTSIISETTTQVTSSTKPVVSSVSPTTATSLTTSAERNCTDVNPPRKSGENWITGCQKCICDPLTATIQCQPLLCQTFQTPICDVGYVSMPALPMENPCCPTFECKRIPDTCVINGTIYTVGTSTVINSCTKCTCSSEKDTVTTENIVLCETVQCETSCPLGYQYMTEDGECCGKCIEVACQIKLSNNTVHVLRVDEILPLDQCSHYKCEKIEDQFVAVQTKRVCPEYDPGECDPDEAETTPDGCCKICKPTNCKPYSKKTVISHGDCESSEAVELAYCEGTCPGSSVYSLEANQMENECSCCRDSSSQTRSVTLTCQNGTTINYNYIYVEQCQCMNACASKTPPSYDSQLKQALASSSQWQISRRKR